MAKKKHLAPGPRRAGVTPRELHESPARARAYPSVADVLARPDLAAIVRGACVSGLVLLAGCAAPVCEASSTDELLTHGRQAFREAMSLEVSTAADELGVGIGIKPHPVGIMMAGAMPPGMPTPPPPTPTPTPTPTD
jgi:hypothetical protein